MFSTVDTTLRYDDAKKEIKRSVSDITKDIIDPIPVEEQFPVNVSEADAAVFVSYFEPVAADYLNKQHVLSLERKTGVKYETGPDGERYLLGILIKLIT